MMRGTTLLRLRRIIERRLADHSSERGVAMLTAILFMVIMAGVSMIILGVVTTQATPSLIAQKSTKTVYSAQAGIQAALAIMRSAGTVDGTGATYGDPTKLPCSLSSTPTNGVNDGNAYSVTIAYYASDPTPHATDASWLSTNKISCNTGTYGSSGNGPVSNPKFVLLTSAGAATQIPNTASTGNRSVTAVYQFQIKNVNVLGGLITNTGGTACLQADGITAGSTITFVASASCGATTTNAALQLWSYTTSWQLALSSTTAGGVPGMCISGSVPTSPAGTHYANATLQPCAGSTDPTRWNQLWSWTGNYTWEGENTAITGPNSSAWLTPAVPDGTNPTATKLRVSDSVTGTLAPTSLVGAGGAKYSTHQLVNYQEFGRCTDVTGEVITNTYMIDYPCKQDPTGGTSYITWNQKYYYCEAADIGTIAPCSGYLPDGTKISLSNQQIYVYYQDNTSQKYCFTAPTATTSTSSGPVYYPYFTACATSGPLVALQVWSRVYNTGTFSTSYLIINKGLRPDLGGLCLMANNSPGTTFSSSPVISELTLAQCNGSALQQWNAVPTYVGGTVGGYREISGG